MQTSLVFLLALGFSGCGIAQGLAATYRRIPYSENTRPEHRDQLTTRAYRDGRLFWHGRTITMPVLQDHLRRARTLDPLPYLVLEYEAGIDTATLASLRRVFDEDGGCNGETICSERQTTARQGQSSRRSGRRYFSDASISAQGEVGRIPNGSAVPVGSYLASSSPEQACIRTTIAALGADPGSYDGRRVCVSGFFGRIVPHGETSFELFATRPEAEATRADFFLGLGIRWDVMLQERLSRQSANFARVEGIFEHDRQCWPETGESESDYRCSPPRPMRLRYVLLRFSDGTEYRHPEFNQRVQRDQEHPRGQAGRLVSSAFEGAMNNDRATIGEIAVDTASMQRGTRYLSEDAVLDLMANPRRWNGRTVTVRIYPYDNGFTGSYVVCFEQCGADYAARSPFLVYTLDSRFAGYKGDRAVVVTARYSSECFYTDTICPDLRFGHFIELPSPQTRNRASAGIQGANAVSASASPRRRSVSRDIQGREDRHVTAPAPPN